jgi:hypothetical protein
MGTLVQTAAAMTSAMATRTATRVLLIQWSPRRLRGINSSGGEADTGYHEPP